jgi:mRNA-degrading endonuclease YafQ of YafQ-DinJ toxin-antitoxin module
LTAAFHESVASFLVDPASVDAHALEGKMGLYRAFSINDDYRVVYTETPEYFLFQDVGTHKQVYQR